MTRAALLLLALLAGCATVPAHHYLLFDDGGVRQERVSVNRYMDECPICNPEAPR